MINIFILTNRLTGEQGFYTTLAALCEGNSKDSLGVSKYTLDRVDFASTSYENDLYKIEQKKLKTKGDIIRERNMTNM